MQLKFLALALFAVPGLAQAYSFAGDWTFEYDATINVVTALANTTQIEVGSNTVNVTQTTTDSFSFPFSIGVISGSGDFTVSGTTVTDTNGGQTTDPFFVDFNGTPFQIRVTYPSWNLQGEITGINSSEVDGFGARAYEITGQPTLINNVQIEAFLGTWINLGSNSSISINSWSMERSAEAVPEPSLAAATIVGLAALRKRKKSSR